MKKISLHNFKHTLRDIHINSENRKLCFIMGSGTSYKSGIPTGGQLATEWFEEIEERYSTEELKQWIEEEKLNKKDLAAHYGSIYRKRFENDKTSGYEFLVQAMKSAKPTFGHIVLAQILTKAPGNCVLTTNFDSLIESSIYQYTDKTPLVCGHESLSGYARPSNIHPLIIKIHRDLLLSPKSDPDEINTLDDGWNEPLDNIFSSHIPIVIGYGGNDGSLMAYFEKMNKPSNFFWCGHKKTKPSARIIKLMEQMDGSYIEIGGFDEMMQELLWVFDEIKPIKEELEDITKSRIEAMNTQLNDMIIEYKTIDSPEVKLKKEISAFEYSRMAENEPDYEKRDAIYLEALDKFPKTAWLWRAYTYFLQFVKKDYTDLEDYYLKALTINPEDGDTIGNYAIYLETIKKDYVNAEKNYIKSLTIDPKSANKYGNYAVFLKEIKKDYVNAKKYYLEALSIEPENANTHRNYANFMNKIKDYVNAEKHYLKALSIKPENAFNNENYAIFLTYTKKDYENAGKYYLNALSLDSEDSNINGNYAVFLMNTKKDYETAEKHYLKALSIDSENANINGNYANFLLIRNRKDEATNYLEKAFILNKNEKNDLLIELWFYKYAHYFESLEESEKIIEELLKDGIQSINWDLDQNIEVAIENNHPNPEKLKEFAERITKLEV
ncbi:MAG: hypothetical protein V4572_05955 [Bacteroidota bacterium]